MDVRIYSNSPNPPIHSFKTFAAGVGPDEMYPFIAVAPQHVMIQTEGPSRDYNPFERIFMDLGFVPMVDLRDAYPEPMPSWTVTRMPGDRIWLREGAEDFYLSSSPTPDVWFKAAEQQEMVVVMFIRKVAVNITRELFLDTLQNDSGLMLSAKYEG